MASYCIRCGQKIGLFKSLSLPEGPLCDECLQELGFTTDDKKRYDSMKGNYELLLAEARLRNPAILSFAPGTRKTADRQDPIPLPPVRYINQILDEDYWVKDVPIRLSVQEKCYYRDTLTVSFKSQTIVTKGGTTTQGISVNLGHGLRYHLGASSPSKKTVKETTNSYPCEVLLTNEQLILRIKKKQVEVPLFTINNIDWKLLSCDVYTNSDSVTFSNKIFGLDRFHRAFELIGMKEKEDYLIAQEQQRIQEQKAQQKKIAQSTKKGASKTKAKDSSDPISLLREYKQLLDDGILTEEEFAAKKAELLKK